MRTSIGMTDIRFRPKKQKPSDPGKTENEGIHRIPKRRLADWAGLILLLTEKFGPAERDRDEHNQTDILTSGLTSLPPSRSCSPLSRPPHKQWLLGVCSPLQWRNRPRFSRGSLTPGCLNFQRTK